MSIDKDLPFSTLFVELDTILDTRIGALALMGGDTLSKVLNSDYHRRLIDRFPNIDNDKFKEIYDSRNKKILQYSMITPIIDIISQFIATTLRQVITTPFHYKPKIALNIYPYKLTDEEVNNIIKVLVELTMAKADIEIVSMSYDEITPRFVKQNLSVLILYEYYKWLEIHSANEAFKKVTCPEVTLIAPSIYFNPIKANTSQDINSFKIMEEMAAPLVGLCLIDIKYFSMVIKVKDTTV